MMLRVGGQIRFDLMTAVTASLGAVCAEPLGGSGDTQPLSRSSRGPTCVEQHGVSKGITYERLPCTPHQTVGDFSNHLV